MRSVPAVVTPSAIAAPPPSTPDRTAQPSIAAHPFAEMLRQNRVAATTPPANSAGTDQAEPGPAQVAASQGNDATPPEAPAPQGDATPAKTRATGSSRGAARSASDKTATPDASTSTSTNPATTDKSQDTSTAAGCPNADAATLANAQAVAAQSADFRAADARGGPAASNDAARSGNASTPGTGTALPFDASSGQRALAGPDGGRAASLSAADDATAKGDLVADKSADASTTGSFATSLAETKFAAATGSPGDHTGHDALAQAASPAAFATATAPAAGNTATTATSLPVPVHSPEFAAAFGLQVSGLAQEGVQRAELHLNPAEMGPVSIQITLDGTQARVDFGADVAATRHAIEAGLPELASALRDAGFTLAGGGVAQHSSSGGSADQGSRRGTSPTASATAVASVEAAAQRLSRNVSAGGIDVYA